MSSPSTPPSTSTAATAEAAALQLAAEAGALDLAAAAGAEEGEETLATLLAHELATGHLLMMRLAARAGAFLDEAARPNRQTSAGPASRRRGSPARPGG